MARVPNNADFNARKEFSDIFGYFLGNSWFILTQLAFYLCLLSQNVAAIVATAQVLDSLAATALPGSKTYALHLGTGYTLLGGDSGEEEIWNLGSNNPVNTMLDLGWLGRIIDWSETSDCPLAIKPGYHHHSHRYHRQHHDYYTTACAPFTYGIGHPYEESAIQPAFVLSLGYIVCAALFYHLGRVNLEENMCMQIISFVALVVIAGEFIWQFCTLAWPTTSTESEAAAQAPSSYENTQGGDAASPRVPAFGSDWSSCLGVVIFNFNFAVTLPSWVNEKKEGVDVNRIVWGSTLASTLLYAAVGWLGGLAFAHIPDNMLELLASHAAVGPLTRVCALLFGVAIIGLGIPIFCVLMRYNLVLGGVCEQGVGAFMGGVLPWLISWAVYQGHAVMNLLTWTGLILNGFIDFLCPVIVAFVAVRAAGGSVLAESEKDHPNRLSWYQKTKSLQRSGSWSTLEENEEKEPRKAFLKDVSSLMTSTSSVSLARVAPPTAVRALPTCLQWQHELFLAALGVLIFSLLAAGLILKALASWE